MQTDAVTTRENPREQEALEAGVRAVVYGLPLVIMNITMKNATNALRPKGMAAPGNQFANLREYPTAEFKQVVRANVDTLYSSAFLDLTREPIVLSVPDTHGRYYLLPMFDAWTNVFASPGARTTGTEAGRFVITGPEWTGPLPAGMHELKSPTNMVWILGRTQTNGPEDYPAVHAIQNGYQLIPLSGFGKPYTAPEGGVDPNIDMKTPPVEQLQRMSAVQYFDELARLLKSNPPPRGDAGVLTELAKIGVVPGGKFDTSKLDPAVARGLERSVTVALERLQEAAKQTGTPVHGWRIPAMILGDYGTNYRA
jgi:DNA sulfur modification protein DndE